MDQSPLFVFDLENSAKSNPYFRSVVYTSKLQMTLMTLRPGEDIPMEVHPDTDQIIIILNGRGVVRSPKLTYPIQQGSTVIIPPGTYHQFINNGETLLQLASIYSNKLHGEYDREVKDPKTGEVRLV